MGKKVVIVGGGAAGLFAAGVAAARGHEVLLLEKTETPGKKIRISGKGRCNLTNTADLPSFVASYPGNGRFLYGALSRFTNQDLLEFFKKIGVETKKERGGRVFPLSDDANEVADALISYAKAQGVKILHKTRVVSLLCDRDSVQGVVTEEGKRFLASCVLLSTGGASYPGTGSTGDGYTLAKEVGHSIVPLRPSMVPLCTQETWVQDLQGLALKNVELRIRVSHKEYSQFGEMLFTHFGISGPIVLTLSDHIREKDCPVTATIDLKPALDSVQLDKRIQEDLSEAGKKQMVNSLKGLLPKALIPVVLAQSGIREETLAHQLTKEEKKRLRETLKGLSLTITKTLPIAAAIVTAGGVMVKEVNPRTMESKRVLGLFFAGEVLDIHGVTGGYNLQAAFSTGVLAARSF